jgi:hypothetical protein
VQEGYSAPCIAPVPRYLKKRPLNKIFEEEQIIWTRKEVQRLVQVGALEWISKGWTCPKEIAAACYIRLAPKKGPKKWRLVVNQRPLKSFLRSKSVQYEDLTHISSLVQKGWWASSFDLESGYHHVSIRPDFRAYLGIF